MNSLLIVIPILSLLMFELGLTLDVGDFRRLVHQPRALIVGLLGQCLVLPLLAVGVGIVFDLEPYIFLGLLLIACSPGGSSSNVFTMLARGDVALSVALTMLSSVVTLLTIPIIMQAGVWLVDAVEDATIELPIFALVVQNIALVAVPIALGLLFRHSLPSLAGRVKGVISRITLPALVTLVAIFFIQNRAVIFENIASLGLSVLIFILLACFVAVVISRKARLNRLQERTITIEVGMQNAAQSIAIATSPFIFNSTTMATPAIIYALVMNIVLLGYLFLIRRGRVL